MTEDKSTVYGTIESLQMQEDYEELNQIVQFAVDAILNDGAKLTLALSPLEYDAVRKRERIA